MILLLSLTSLSTVQAEFESKFISLSEQTEANLQEIIDTFHDSYYAKLSQKYLPENDIWIQTDLFARVRKIRNVVISFLNENNVTDETFYALEYLSYRFDQSAESLEAHLDMLKSEETTETITIVVEETASETTDTNEDTNETEQENSNETENEETTTNNKEEDTIVVTKYYEDDKNILAWTISDPIVKFELIAQLEWARIHDLTIISSTNNSSFSKAISKMKLYDENWMFLAESSVSSKNVTFNNMNRDIAEGQNDLYIVIETEEVWYNKIGPQVSDFTLSLEVNDAIGLQSWRTPRLTGTYESSERITILPALLSKVHIKDERQNYIIDSFLPSGTETPLGLLVISTATSNNTDTQSWSDLDIIMEEVRVDVLDGTKANNLASTLKISREDSPTRVWGNVNPDGSVSFNLSSLWNDQIIQNGNETIFVIYGTPTLDSTTQESLRIDLYNTNSWGITYRTTDTSSITVDKLHIRYVDHDWVLLKE